MSSRTRVQSFALHSLGALASQASGVLSIVALAGIGGLALLGEIGLATAPAIFLSSVFTASLALATNITVAREHGKSQDGAGAVSICLLQLGWIAAGIAGAIAMLVSLAFGSRPGVNLALACAVYCTFTSTNNIQMSVVKGFGDFKASAVLAICGGALKFVILIPFLWKSRDAAQFIWAMVAGQAATNLLYCRWITKHKPRDVADFSDFKRLHLAEVKKFVLGNLPSNLMIAGYNWACVLALGSYAGPEEAGKWSIGQRLINVITFLPQRFADVNLTHLSRNGGGTHVEAWQRGIKAAGLCLLFSIPMVLAGWLFANHLGALSDALDAASLAPFVLVAAFMLLVRFRVQHDFSRLCSSHETRSAFIRIVVLFIAVPALATVGMVSSESLGYVWAFSYFSSAAMILLTEQ